jgi:hypothetical protein
MILFQTRLALSVVAMAGFSAPIAAQGTNVRDSAVFIALARAVVADTQFSHPVALQIDPTPYMGESSHRSAKLPMSSAELEARNGALKLLGAPLGDARLPVHCAGVMVPYSPRADHKGCPSQLRTVASIGLVHVVRHAPMSKKAHEREPNWAVPVLLTTSGPQGVSLLVWEYFVNCTSGPCTVTKGKLTSFRE